MGEAAAQILREADLYGLLRTAIASAGSQEAWARSVPVSASFVSEVMGGRKSFSPRMLAALGVEEVKTFRRLDPAASTDDASRLLAGLSKADTRTLLWLRADGSARKRLDVMAGEWRPLLENLKRLRGMRLAEEVFVAKLSQGWAATEAGLAARAAIQVEGAADA